MAIGDPKKEISQDYASNETTMVGDGDYDPIGRLSDYQFMTNAYDGSGGFRTGRFLIPHTTEILLVYTRRQALSYYKNYVQPIIRATIDPVFAAEIKRLVMVQGEVVTDGMYATEFLKDTGDGQDIEMFTDQALTLAAQHGCCFVIMDNADEETISNIKNKKIALESRAFPYVYIRTMDELHSSKQNKMGKLEWARFYDGKEKVKTDNGYREVNLYMYYDNNVIRKEIEGEDGSCQVVSETPNKLGRLPVIPVYYEIKKSRCDNKIELDPPFYDIARINHSIFNKDSMITASERSQGFSIFYMQEDKPGTVVIGRHNYISLPMDTTIAPGFATPSPEILSKLVENNEKLREDLFRIAGQKGVDFRSSQAKSGDALEWEFIAQEVVLSRTAKRGERLEKEMMDLLKLFTKEQYDYVCEYPKKFRPDTEDNELVSLDKLLMIIDVKREDVRSYIEKQAFLTVAKKWNPEEVKVLLESFDADKLDDKEDKDKPLDDEPEELEEMQNGTIEIEGAK